MKSKSFTVLAIAMILAMIVVPVSASPAPEAAGDVYIIRLKDAPLATYNGGVAGLEATTPAASGQVKLDATSPASVAYSAYLAENRAQFITAMEQSLDREVEVLFEYYVTYNGMAARLSAAEAAQVAALPGVVNVQADVIRYPLTDYGPAWIGAEGIWDGTTTGGLDGTMGEGVIVGILDTGLNMDHPSFAATSPAPDSYTHVNPYGSGNYVGLCDSAPGTWVCNDKLIGYWIYTGETHEDTDGHGSHTGSTTAGNPLPAGMADLTPYAYSPAISGVAPHANVIGYDVCDDDGGCPGAASIAATDQTVLDGVDVINFSIGGGTSNPWTDAGSLAFLAASAAGVVPVTSAGNNGPGASTVGSPGDSPWMFTIGASTHNRAGLQSLINMTDDPNPGLADIQGKGFSAGYGPAPIVYAGDYGDALCANEFTGGTFSGEIVVCDRGGGIARVTKGYNVLQGGAGGYVLANADAGETLNGDVHHLPAIHIMYDDGVALKAWMAAATNPMAEIAGTVVSVAPANADVMAGFSSRGPLVNTASDVIKPDVTAPGVDILAAYRSNPPDPGTATVEYGVVSGTSMSSPHTAGASALMRALHPGWSPAKIQSAIMSTAVTAGVLKEDGVTPADAFDIGAGRVDLSLAGDTGLVLDITEAEFQAANPGLGGEPKSLNLASLADDACADTCSWTRTVSSTLAVAENWTASVVVPTGMVLTVTPANFSLAAFAEQALTIDADVSALDPGDWAFAEVILTPDTAGLPAVHFPVAVVPEASAPEIGVGPASLASGQLVGGTDTQELTIANNGETDLDWFIYEDAGSGRAPELVDWYEDWDSYATGSQAHGQGGWKGWGDDVTWGALIVDTYANSAPNSVEIVVDSDLVHEYSGYDSGLWTYTAWQYVPSNMTGDSFFILLNQYDDAGATNNWSTQVHFNGDTDLVIADGVGATYPGLPLIRDQWVELRVEINLAFDHQAFYYDDVLLFEGSWSDGVSGGGIANIGAVDLFANGASEVYYDDISLVETIPETCDLINDIPWVSADPEDGTVLPGETGRSDVTFDATGLMPGLYEGTLCVGSNDPVTPIVEVPLALTVAGEWDKTVDGQAWTDGMSVTYEAQDVFEVVDTLIFPGAAPVAKAGASFATDAPSVDLAALSELALSAPNVEGAASPAASPEDVLWEQVTNVTGAPAAQYFPDFSAGLWSADDFQNTEWWDIDTIYVPGSLWNGDGDLLDADTINWFIYADAGDTMPPGVYPDDGSGTELWSLSLAPTDPAVTIGGANDEATVDIVAATGGALRLEPGHYWLVFFPAMDFVPYGQFGWQVAGTTNLAIAMQADPDGLIALQDWTPWDTINPAYYDGAFRLEGSIYYPPVFELTETWDTAELALLGYEVSAGTVVSSAGQLVWSGPTDEFPEAVITKTFHVEPCTWEMTTLTEDLVIPGAVASKPVDIYKTASDLWIDVDTYDPIVQPGDTVEFTLLYGNDGGLEPGVFVRIEFPPEAPFESSIPAPDYVNPDSLWAEWAIGDMANGDAGSIDVTVTVSDTVMVDDMFTAVGVIVDHTDSVADFVDADFTVGGPDTTRYYLPIIVRDF